MGTHRGERGVGSSERGCGAAQRSERVGGKPQAGPCMGYSLSGTNCAELQMLVCGDAADTESSEGVSFWFQGRPGTIPNLFIPTRFRIGSSRSLVNAQILSFLQNINFSRMQDKMKDIYKIN